MENKNKKYKSLEEALMNDSSLYTPLAEMFKGWSCEVDKEGIKVFKQKEDDRTKR